MTRERCEHTEGLYSGVIRRDLHMMCRLAGRAQQFNDEAINTRLQQATRYIVPANRHLEGCG